MFKKIMKYVLIIAAIIIVICLGTIIYSFANKDEGNDTISKVNSELKYLDTKLMAIANKLNNFNKENLITSNEVDNINSNIESNSSSGSSSSSSGGGSSSSRRFFRGAR